MHQHRPFERRGLAPVEPGERQFEDRLRLTQRIEGNLLAAAQEIDKLALLVRGDGGAVKTLDADTMESLVADSARFDVFRLVDAALNGNPPQVSRMLAGLRAEGAAIPALMGMVAKELQAAATLAYPP